MYATLTIDLDLVSCVTNIFYAPVVGQGKCCGCVTQLCRAQACDVHVCLQNYLVRAGPHPQCAAVYAVLLCMYGTLVSWIWPGGWCVCKAGAGETRGGVGACGGMSACVSVRACGEHLLGWALGMWRDVCVCGCTCLYGCLRARILVHMPAVTWVCGCVYHDLSPLSLRGLRANCESLSYTV